MNNISEYSRIASQMRIILSSKTYPSNEELYLDLIETEDIWKQTLLSTSHGFHMYSEFINFIVNEKKNILDARPFFRIRQSIFLKQINPYIRKNKPDRLMKHRVSHAFVSWAMSRYYGPHLILLKNLENKIIQLRADLLNRNFPLVLNRIKIIIHTYPNVDNVQDLVNIASGAALQAIDKFAPTKNKRTGEEKYTPVFLSSIIARIHAAVLQHFSSQTVHYYPKDKKMLMEVNKLRKANLSDLEICDKLDISEGEMSRLFSGFFTTPLDDMSYILEDKSMAADEEVIETESKEKLKEAFDKLSILEQKILKLKRLNIE